MNWKNNLTSKLGIEFPFIQAPMLGVTSPEMVAAVSNKGGLGSLPLGLTAKEQAAVLIQSVKKQTAEAFSVNLFVYHKSSIGRLPSLEILQSFYKNHGLDFPGNQITEDPFPLYTELIDLINEENIPVVSFTFGLPDSETVKRLKTNGCVLIGSASSVKEAKMIEGLGMDAVVAQGIEAGGHRASLIENQLPQIGLISLLPQVIDAVRIPVIAAGGLMEGRSIAAAFVLGAQGVQSGSAFLRSTESMASGIYKASVASAIDTSTALTNAWTGKYARGIQNSFSIAMQKEDILPYPFQIYYTDKLRKIGREKGLEHLQAFWAGQSCGFAKSKSAGEIISELIKDTETVLSGKSELF